MTESSRSSATALALTAAILSSALPARATDPAVQAPLVAAGLRDAALAGSGAYEVVRSLTTEVGPRLAGSPGDAAAVVWGTAKLRALGFENVRAEEVTVPHWERGKNAGAILAPWPQPVALTALGGSAATPAGGIEAEVVGVATLEELEKLDPVRAKGKIVFVGNRMERTSDGSGYGRAVGVRGAGAAVAARLGAAALLIRSIGTDSNRLPHTGAMRPAGDGPPPVPAAALSAPDADLLEQQLASGRPVRFRLELDTRRFDDARSANVIGEVVGRGAPEEIVLAGCHLDSWDLGTGALDDGAGCAIVIEAARRIGRLPIEQRPRRTIRVVLFANEEFGLSGARAYAEAHAAELTRHLLAGEADFGAGRVQRIRTRVAPAALEVFAKFADAAAPLGVAFDRSNDSGGGADLSPLAPAGVPIVSFEQDGSTYFDVHHTANDTLDKIDAKDLDQVVAVWAAVLYQAAASDATFGPAPQPAERRR